MGVYFLVHATRFWEKLKTNNGFCSCVKALAGLKTGCRKYRDWKKKNRHILKTGQGNRKESPEIDPHLHALSIYGNGGKSIQ